VFESRKDHFVVMSDCVTTESPGSIVLQIVSSGGLLKRALVRENQQCQVLGRLFPDQSVVFIYRGEQLIEQFSFGHYNIRSGESIFVLPKGQEGQPALSIQSQPWIRLSNDPEAISRLVDSVVNVNTRREVMRLRDIVLLRREMRCRHRSTFEQPPPLPAPDHIQPDRHQTVIVSPMTELVSEPLPVIW
jgi:hypothetical protein